MNLSEASKMRFNGIDVKLAKINGDIIYRKEEENPLLKARYTTNESGVVPTFNSGYGYEVNESNDNGVYTVEITSEDDFSSCSFNEKSGLLTVEYLKVTSKVTDMRYMFQKCTKLTSLDLSNFDTSKVLDMRGMFQNCTKLTSLDLSVFDTSKVLNMYAMFYNCGGLTSLDLSNFDTSKVTDMRYMFHFCGELTSLDSMMNIATSLDLPSSLNGESVLDVVDNLATVTSTNTLRISNTQLSWISEDKITEANNKGWTISV